MSTDPIIYLEDSKQALRMLIKRQYDIPCLAISILFITPFVLGYGLQLFTNSNISLSQLIFFSIFSVPIVLFFIRMITKLYLIEVRDENLYITPQLFAPQKDKVILPTKSIIQIYIRRNKEMGHALFAKFDRGRDMILINYGVLDLKVLNSIEIKLEDYLDLEDDTLPDEYTGIFSRAKIQHNKAKRAQGPFIPEFLQSIYRSSIGDILHIKNEEFKITNIHQIDWNDDNSDKQLQAYISTNEQLIYIENNKKLLRSYKERRLDLHEKSKIKFSPQQMLNSITFQNRNLTLISHKTGEAYFLGVNQTAYSPTKVEQWLYQDINVNVQLRIFKKGNEFTYYYGERIEEDDFNAPLDLNKIKEEEEEIILRQNSRDEDFV